MDIAEIIACWTEMKNSRIEKWKNHLDTMCGHNSNLSENPYKSGKKNGKGPQQDNVTIG